MVLDLWFASGEVTLSVRRFAVREHVSGLFDISVLALSPNHSVDLASIVGKPASLRVASGLPFAALGGARYWTGVCWSMELIEVEPTGLSTYDLRIVPELWRLGQRTNYRIFQHLSIPDIVDGILTEWSIEPAWKIDRAGYPKLEYRVQYGETDLGFMSRLLEEAGIAYTFPDDPTKGSKLTLSDALHLNTPRAAPILFAPNPTQAAATEIVTRVGLLHEVRAGAHVIRDVDFRNPTYALVGEAAKAKAPEDRLERYHYEPGAFLVETGKPGDTPAADDRGVARHDEKYGKDRAQRALEAERTGKRAVTFQTNVTDLWPGVVFSIAGHPHSDLAESTKLLVTELILEATREDPWRIAGHAVFADQPHRPAILTPKPVVFGVETATVVGPRGQEIHTDEFGRIRVQFPWDRAGKNDDTSSCWIRVSQGWAGAGSGMITLPRVGHEVLVGFVAGDPEQPLVVGRVFNAKSRVPYKLPEHKTRSTWKSDSSPGSEGSNEIMFEDLKGNELVYVQAQKDLRAVVKHDETTAVGNDREMAVGGNERQSTKGTRVEVTGGSRTQITRGDRTEIAAAGKELVKGDSASRTDGSLTIRIGKDHDIVIKQAKRERIEGDSHLRVKGKRRRKIDGEDALTVGGDRQEKVGGSHLLAAGKEIHLVAGSALVIEASEDVTIKGPGGFIRIDASGVTIKGTLVKINSGGAAGSGTDASPAAPEDAHEAEVEEPEAPKPGEPRQPGGS
jgi:type VI secretion system secreted protein VgrG